eukprot:997617-Prorocentrum_minimum.AAC.2
MLICRTRDSRSGALRASWASAPHSQPSQSIFRIWMLRLLWPSACIMSGSVASGPMTCAARRSCGCQRRAAPKMGWLRDHSADTGGVMVGGCR